MDATRAPVANLVMGTDQVMDVDQGMDMGQDMAVKNQGIVVIQNKTKYL
ncbi:MAG: hypothetical protein MI740_07115 [Halanaerobiales bacterium]|nr:hypothetical protein [Halanaerobiales bacterium]